jgi:hypothetical protein
MCNNMTSVVFYNIMRKEDLGLKITVSKGVEDKDTIKSIWINSEKKASLLMI